MSQRKEFKRMYVIHAKSRPISLTERNISISINIPMTDRPKLISAENLGENQSLITSIKIQLIVPLCPFNYNFALYILL
jgi:hypothetical protein